MSQELIERLREAPEFCDGCSYYGEPNGCNLNGVGCKAWDYAQQAADTIQYLLDGADEVNQALREQIAENERLKAEKNQIQETLDIYGGDCGITAFIEQLEKLKAENAILYTAHDVALILAEAVGDDCACNVNGNDEWLPEKCELLDACPDPLGVACWEQYLKWRGVERKEDIK